MSRGSSVGILSGYELDDRGAGVGILVGSTILTRPYRLWNPPNPEVKRRGREAGHSPTGAEGKKSLFCTCKDNLTRTLLCCVITGPASIHVDVFMIRIISFSQFVP